MNDYARVIGTGSYLPSKILTNDDLEKKVNTTSQWIESRVGISQRHIAAKHETTSTMAYESSVKAIKAAAINVSDIDLIIVATSTPDKFLPSVACHVQSQLGIKSCVAFDVQAACSGFVYAVHVADQMMKTGIYQHVLVIGSEVMSRIVNWEDRGTCVLFGDGAGAVVLKRDNVPGIMSTYVSSEGEFRQLLYANNEITSGTDKHGSSYIVMEGKEVYKLAVDRLEKLVVEMLKQQRLTQDDLDWLIPHQANYRIIKSMAKKLNFPMKKVILTLQNQGNTSCASIPLAFDLTVQEGRIKRGELVLLEAFGAGITFGGILLKY